MAHPVSDQALDAVLFDWGGTLTPFHDVDMLDAWRQFALIYAPERAEELATSLALVEERTWNEAVITGRSWTTEDLVSAAAEEVGVPVDDVLHRAAFHAYLERWTPHTATDPLAAPTLQALRSRGLRTGLLSNTHWPREWHERFLQRDGVLELLDARTYTSDLRHVKPHPAAFRAAMTAVGVSDPERVVFVGDRPIDDISGAKRLGMRAVLVPNPHVPRGNGDAATAPDATITELPELIGLIDGWLAG